MCRNHQECFQDCLSFASLVLQVQEFLARFESIPDMLELDHLTVSGDVTFGKNVSLKVTIVSIHRPQMVHSRACKGTVQTKCNSSGITECLIFKQPALLNADVKLTRGFSSVFLQGTVIIIANHGDRIDIPAGAMLENKIVSGNLRILDH